MELITLADFLNIPKARVKGKVICFPTDTVYGIGAIATDEVAINKIFAMKKRLHTKPLVILTDDLKQIKECTCEVPIDVLLPITKHWPGALTVIFKKSKPCFPDATLNKDTIAFRVPNSYITLQLISHLGPLATTSVNISGQNELHNISQIEAQFGNEIDYCIIDNTPLTQTSSTIIDVTTGNIKVVRQGDIKF